MSLLFSDKCALVTGASSGLGRFLAIELSALCRKLYLTGRDLDNLLETAKKCPPECDISIVPADLASIEGVYSLLTSLDDDVDMLFNVAGVFPLVSISQTSDDAFEECMALNVRAPFILSRELAKNMVERNWGRIVNIGSSSSYAGSEASGAYCSSKHALLGLSRSLFLELRTSGVRVHFVAPGSLQTPMGKLDYRQDYNTFIQPQDAASFIIRAISYDGEMVSEEIRLNRMVIR